MTLKTKKILFNTSLLTACLIPLFFITAIVVKGIELTANSTVFFIISIISLSSVIVLKILYNKTLPSEVIFFGVFLVSIGIQSLRFIPIVIEINSYFVYSTTTRIVSIFKYLSLFALLGSSLYSYIVKKQKVGTWLLFSLLAGIVISSILNLSSNYCNISHLSPVISKSQESLLVIVIFLLLIITNIKSWLDSKNKEYITLGISSILLALGMEMLFITHSEISGFLSILFLFFGIFLHFRSIHNISLWS